MGYAGNVALRNYRPMMGPQGFGPQGFDFPGGGFDPAIMLPLLRMLISQMMNPGAFGQNQSGDNFARMNAPSARTERGVENVRPRNTTRAGDFQNSRELRRAGATTTAGPNGTQGSRLFRAIVGQESGGRNMVNPHSGASGIGQVMPANIRSWSREALGYSITPEQFRARPDLQARIVQFKLDQYYQEGLRATGGNQNEAVRYAAAKWYSGNGNLRNSTRPQYTRGHRYPSIAEYSNRVLQRYLATR